MPKTKTHSGLKKRIKVTGTGKLQRGNAYSNHNASHKTTKKNRTLRKESPVHSTDFGRIKGLISDKL